MRLTKYRHACVRIEDGDRVLVIDPGIFSEAEALAGATSVLITHEHVDHIDVDKLSAARENNPELTVYTHPALAALDAKAIAVSPGESFTAAGFAVDVVGGAHAEIIDGLPGCPNIGFIVEGVYHPGDSLFVPAEPVETLLVPASGPWLKVGEAVEFVRAVRPARTFPIHEALLSDIGINNFDGWLGDEGATDYARVPPGESVEL
jgi:L-ascorbate metabolism protein UlaG (beta-lactamase superfamily)